MKLISQTYLQMQRRLHKRRGGFGGSGWRWAEQVLGIISAYHVESMLDYGCGEETLYAELCKHTWPNHFSSYRGYDPCVEECTNMPQTADLVTCTDVLEHIELDYLDNVLGHIKSLTHKVILFNIALHLANKRLPDGRNAHLIVKSKDWWDKKLQKHFGGWPKNELPVDPKRAHKDYLFYLVNPDVQVN